MNYYIYIWFLWALIQINWCIQQLSCWLWKSVFYISLPQKDSTLTKHQCAGPTDHCLNIPHLRIHTFTVSLHLHIHLSFAPLYGMCMYYSQLLIGITLKCFRSLYHCTSKYLVTVCLHSQISSEKGFRDSQHLLTRYFEDFGCLGYDITYSKMCWWNYQV